MKFPWHKKHHHKPVTYWPDVETPAEEAEEMATNTLAKMAALAKADQAMAQSQLANTSTGMGMGVYNSNTHAMQAQLPFGQPMLGGGYSTNLYPQTSSLKTIAVELDNIVVKKVRNGYVLHVHDSHGEPKVYVCGEADDVGEALKVALVNLRIDAVK